MTNTQLAPEITSQLDQGHKDQLAHLVDQRPVERGGTGQDIATAIILGNRVTALCGYEWVPFRDPQGRPVCQGCIEQYDHIMQAMDGRL